MGLAEWRIPNVRQQQQRQPDPQRHPVAREERDRHPRAACSGVAVPDEHRTPAYSGGCRSHHHVPDAVLQGCGGTCYARQGDRERRSG